MLRFLAWDAWFPVLSLAYATGCDFGPRLRVGVVIRDKIAMTNNLINPASIRGPGVSPGVAKAPPGETPGLRVPLVAKRRLGVTMVEVLLVLAIIVAVAGIAVPSFDSMISSRRIKNSTDTVALDISEARVRAMRTGQAQVFTATLDGSQYTIEPWLNSYDEVDASAGATIKDSVSGSIVETQSAAEVSSFSDEEQGSTQRELESGVQFFAVETLVDTRNAAAIETTTGVGAATAAVAGSGTSNPVLLYPDGTSTTAQIVLVDEHGRRMVISLRGVTGRVSVYRTSSVDPSSVTMADTGGAPSP